MSYFDKREKTTNPSMGWFPSLWTKRPQNDQTNSSRLSDGHTARPIQKYNLAEPKVCEALDCSEVASKQISMRIGV